MITFATKSTWKPSIQEQQASLDLEYSQGYLSKLVCRFMWATGLRKKLSKKRLARIVRLKEIENEQIFERNLAIYSQARSRFNRFRPTASVY